jgi:hypothetical protein
MQAEFVTIFYLTDCFRCGIEGTFNLNSPGKAAIKLMRKLLKKQGAIPTRVVTDKLRSYHVAFRSIGLTAEHIDNKRAINQFGGGSERCSVSNRLDPLSDF